MSFWSFFWETAYEFSPHVKEMLAAGKLEQVTTLAGHLLPIARNPVTGAFVEIAKGTTQIAAGPLIAATQLVTSVIGTGIESYQTHRGFQKTYREIAVVQEGIKALQGSMQTLQTSVSVLQASTALIGVGVVASTALTAVNLHQVLKLREDMKRLSLEVKDGFIDLKQLLKDQGNEVLQRLDEVANDLKFHSQKLLMMKAYGQFREAVRLISTALVCKDINTRNDTLNAALGLLADSLSIYNSPELFTDTTAVGYLRRVECAWAIEQTIALIFHLRGEANAVSDRLEHLHSKIQHDSLTAIAQCASAEELNFLFPEITRVNRTDLSILQGWQTQVDWMQSLPQHEFKRLEMLKINTIPESVSEIETVTLTQLPEESLYNTLEKTSHFQSLQAQLRFIVKPQLRQEYEVYISQQATAKGHKALVPNNWQEISDATVANLYWYFQHNSEAA